jgi:hypothetical protein
MKFTTANALCTLTSGQIKVQALKKRDYFFEFCPSCTLAIASEGVGILLLGKRLESLYSVVENQGLAGPCGSTVFIMMNPVLAKQVFSYCCLSIRIIVCCRVTAAKCAEISQMQIP